MTQPPLTPLFESVLIANRGEIACRIIRTLRRLGIRSIAVYSDADADALHVRLADEAVRLGPAPAARSYLDIEAVLAAARATGVQAVHPGYGFLAENAAFARGCAEAGIVFVGAPVGAIATMGDKIAAKRAVGERGVPTVPGLARPGLTDAELISAGPSIGFPVLIKPSAGGGGKGMHVVHAADGMRDAVAAARREAAASFGDDTLFLERYLTRPRHIEVQVLADAHGNVVHLGERECSLQRRHQKVIEEAPSPLLDDETRARICAAACETARSVDYRGAGTVEFIVSAARPDEFFFMEMNTRLQVEHPVTEEITGVDLVEQQLRIAAGHPLDLAQDDIRMTGHSIEARVYAEDPRAGFLPTGGRVDAVRHPGGDGIRVDTALADGIEVAIDYDPMIAKVIATGRDRDDARRRLIAALEDTAVFGFATNVEFLTLLLQLPDVVAGRLDTDLIARELDDLEWAEASTRDLIDAAMLQDAAERAEAVPGVWGTLRGFRLGGDTARSFAFENAEAPVVVTLRGAGADGTAGVDGGADAAARLVRSAEGTVTTTVDGSTRTSGALVSDGVVHLARRGAVFRIAEHRPDHIAQGAEGNPHLDSPMPGTVVLLHREDGARVEVGDPVAVVEAMKMEHVVRSSVAGTVSLRVSVGDQVARGQSLAVISPDAEE